MGRHEARCVVDDFERGRLPLVCAVTGDPADGWYRETYESRAGALYLLLLFGLLPFIVVRMLTRKTAEGRIPVSGPTFDLLSQRAREHRRRFLVLLGIGGVVGLAGFAFALSGSETAFPVLAVGVVVTAVAFVLGGRSFLRGHVESSGRWVVIEGVHPAFAAAVAAQARLG